MRIKRQDFVRIAIQVVSNVMEDTLKTAPNAQVPVLRSICF